MKEGFKKQGFNEESVVKGHAKGHLDGFFIFLKGLAMGAADIVPGVSGGTVAFITGIYQRLLAAISAVSFSLLSLWKEQGFKAVWQKVDGYFLVILAAGIFTSILTLASTLSTLLETHPEPLWAFFFGLILASAWVLFLDLIKFKHDTHLGVLLGCIVVGAIFAYSITLLVPLEIEPKPWTLFFAGAIAICAMILPGISGSFMLLIMGLYAPILGAIKSFDLMIIALFGAGCLAGLLSFARLLSWLFKHFPTIVMAVLVGVMLGSLNKVWPWKQTLSYRTNSKGEEVPLLQGNILPFDYQNVVGQDPRLVLSVVMFLVGLGLVIGIYRCSKQESPLAGSAPENTNTQ